MPLTRRTFVSLGALAAVPLRATATSVAEVDPGPFAPAIEPVHAFIQQYLHEIGAPGLTLALADHSGVRHVASFGVADLVTHEPIRVDHQFHIGSISKSMVGLMLMQLVDEGRISVQDPIERHLPGLRFESPGAPITIHHLLTHTAALPDGPLFPPDPGFRHRPAGPLGRDFHYCNQGWRALGHLVEHLDRRSLGESLHARVFAPLGMGHSGVITFDDAPHVVRSYWPARTDRPYAVHDPLDVAPRILETDGAGCVASTPADMGRYLQCLINGGVLPDGRRLVSEKSFAAFTTPHIAADEFGNSAHYGYGLAVDQFDGHRRLRHTGGMTSFASALEVDTPSGIGVFASVNAMQGIRPRPVAEAALRAVRAALEGRPQATLAPRRAPRHVDAPARFIGRYLTAGGPAVQIVADGVGIALEQPALHGAGVMRRPLHPVCGADGLFVTRSGGRDDLDALVFEPAEVAGHPSASFGWGSATFVREGVKRPAKPAAPAAWSAYTGHYRSEDPWAGSHRITLRDGALWMDGAIPLEPTGDGRFWWRNEPTSPEWVAFADVLGGRAMRLVVSGDHLVRISEATDPGFGDSA
jgi:CubicO group peptidase (beta-lactamase class C family)